MKYTKKEDVATNKSAVSSSQPPKKNIIKTKECAKIKYNEVSTFALIPLKLHRSGDFLGPQVLENTRESVVASQRRYDFSTLFEIPRNCRSVLIFRSLFPVQVGGRERKEGRKVDPIRTSADEARKKLSGLRRTLACDRNPFEGSCVVFLLTFRQEGQSAFNERKHRSPILFLFPRIIGRFL